MVPGSVPVAVIRGGTSRGVFVRDEDLPRDPEARHVALLRLFGSGSGEVVDGLGGDNPVLRKVAIVDRRGSMPDQLPVLGYTFGQVDAAMTRVDHGAECGNIASGVPLFGALSDWCPSPSPGAAVMVDFRNTGRRARMEWIDGDRLGGSLRLWLLDPAPGGRDAVLVLGEATTPVRCDPWGDVRCTVVRSFNTHLFIASEDLGLPDPLEPDGVTPETMEGLLRLVRRIERRLGSSRTPGFSRTLGSSRTPGSAQALKVSLEGAPEDGGGAARVRTVYPREGREHPSVAVTGAAALAVAACLEGSVVHRVAGGDPGAELALEHPAGRVVLSLSRPPTGLPSRVGIERSCRVILRGEAYPGGPVPQRAEVV